jgi:hypothetical protein
VAIAKHLHAPPKDPEIVLGSEDRRVKVRMFAGFGLATVSHFEATSAP